MAVTCPHCGGAAGVTPDPRLEAAIAAIATEPPASRGPAIVEQEHPIVEAMVEAVVAVAAAIVDAAVGPVDTAPALPTAIARERPHEIATRPSTEPPESPPAPDEPRLLT
jgi:hypothetical protein